MCVFNVHYLFVHQFSLWLLAGFIVCKKILKYVLRSASNYTVVYYNALIKCLHFAYKYSIKQQLEILLWAPISEGRFMNT